jgi:carbamoyl-phosphate synthase/aspartate carbamoyltransferase/dihydroorotase
LTLLRIPGAVDPHVHLRDLEWSHKGTVERETAAALAGGYWAVLDMPNTPPPATTRARLDARSTAFARSAHCDFGLYVGADQHGNQAEYAAASMAAVGLKMYCDATTGDLLVSDAAERRAHLAAWMAAVGTRKPVAVHAEGRTLAEVLKVAVELRVRLHVCHASLADEMALLREAKRDGAALSVGVTPHHLYLTEEDAVRLGPYGLVRPALRTRADVEALWDGVADGTVDVIESDHAPHARAEKASAAPPPGLPGLETTIPLMILAMRERRLSEERLIELLATNAQRIFGLVPPAETWTIVDTDAKWVVTDEALRTTPGWSPFAGMRVTGRVREVRIRGVLAWDGEEVACPPGTGRDVAWS